MKSSFFFHENLIKDSPLTTFDGKRKKSTHGEDESRQKESRRQKQGDEKENKNGSGDGCRGRESERVRGVQKMKENEMNEPQTCIFRFQRQKLNLPLHTRYQK